jgi:uncharacterized membrane protein
MERSVGVGKEAMACFAPTVAQRKGANQEMDINGIQISKELAVTFLLLLLFGVGYNLVVEHFQKRTQRYTAELVVGGVLVTVLASGFLIGWGDAVVVLCLFVASGSPMVIGSWLRTARDEEAAKKIHHENLQEMQK